MTTGDSTADTSNFVLESVSDLIMMIVMHPGHENEILNSFIGAMPSTLISNSEPGGDDYHLRLAFDDKEIIGAAKLAAILVHRASTSTVDSWRQEPVANVGP